MGQIGDALREFYASVSNRPLPYHIGLQSASLEDSKSCLPVLVETLMGQRPSYWNLGFATEEAAEYYQSRPEFHPFLEQGKVRNEQVWPTAWIARDLIASGYVRDVTCAKINFRSNDYQQFYLETVLTLFDGERKKNVLSDDQNHLSRDILLRGAEQYQFALHAVVFNARRGGAIIQGVCRSLQDRDGLLVVCSKSNPETGKTDEGVVYSLREFAAMNIQQLVAIDELIERRMRTPVEEI